METFLGILGIIALCVAILTVQILFGIRGFKKDLQKWHDTCVQFCSTVMAESEYADFAKDLGISEKRFRTILCVFASVARVERIAGEGDRLNEIGDEDFNSLTDLDFFVSSGSIDAKEMNAVMASINKALIPFRESRTDDRSVFYRCLSKAFLEVLDYKMSSEKIGPHDAFVIGVLNAITVRRVNCIRR